MNLSCRFQIQIEQAIKDIKEKYSKFLQKIENDIKNMFQLLKKPAIFGALCFKNALSTMKLTSFKRKCSPSPVALLQKSRTNCFYIDTSGQEF